MGILGQSAPMPELACIVLNVIDYGSFRLNETKFAI